MINEPSDDEIDFGILDITVGEAMEELFKLQSDHPLVVFMGITNQTESLRRYEEMIKQFNRDTSRLPEGKIELVETLGKYLDALRRALDEVKEKILH